MDTITANELKTKGASAVAACLREHGKAIISVRGKDKYVVMDIKKYAKLREYELEIALLEAKADIGAGRYSIDSVADHMRQVTGEL